MASIKAMATPILLCAASIHWAGCCTTTEEELQRVAKDWCMTIRASQVLPVYPLTEDLQPGDVFVVQTPLSKQTEVYAAKGFLALDQLVVRLKGLPYSDYYSDGYWQGTYSTVPHHRPGWQQGNCLDSVLAPQAAFPSYTFSVKQGAGVKLAIPIQGVPVGLGLMGAQEATGSVSLADAYTYAVDIESVLRSLFDWWRDSGTIRSMMAAMAKESTKPVYLRVVNRVYAVRGVNVQLTNTGSISGGADVGVAQEIKLPDLSQGNPEKAKASADAYKAALETLSSVVGVLKNNMPGGSLRFAHVSRRAVTMRETFDRPLVIGYLGVDLRVYQDGSLSPPIPSYAVLNKEVSFTPGEALSWDANAASERYLPWLRGTGNREAMVEWLKAKGLSADPADLYNAAEYEGLLNEAAEHFKF